MNSTSIVEFEINKGILVQYIQTLAHRENFNIPITSKNGGRVNFTLFDLKGKIISKKHTSVSA